MVAGDITPSSPAGTLDINGVIGDGLTLAIDTTHANTLKIEESATTSLAIDSSAGGSIQSSLNSGSTLGWPWLPG